MEEIFRADAYVKTCEAIVVSIDEAGIELDRTNFYAAGGGQPGDVGTFKTSEGAEIQITDTLKDRATGRHYHVPASDAPALSEGDTVTLEINWERRHKLMRMHSALHLLCCVVDGAVTGGQIGDVKGRLDFDLEDTNLDKEEIAEKLNEIVAQDIAMTSRWITDAELESDPSLVKTMSVRPPSGAGMVRLIEIPGVDLQACGGTHVATTGEIGRLRVGKVENKGKHNRRVNIHFED